MTFFKNDLDPLFRVSFINFRSVDLVGKLGHENVLFINFEADVLGPDERWLPGIVPCLRGGAVVITVILNCDGKEYALLTKQPRFPVGRFEFLENPAGMLDDSGDFTGKAIQELEEEAGIQIRREDARRVGSFTGTRWRSARGGGGDSIGGGAARRSAGGCC